MKKLSYNYGQKFLIFDFESTNLNLIYARPFELGFIITQNKKILKEYQAYIWWPDLKMSKGAAAVTRFNYEEYKEKARPPEEVFTELKKWIDDPEIIYVAHNGIGFDWSIYKTWAKIMGKWDGWGDKLERTIDTMLCSRIYNDGRRPDSNFLSSQLKEMGKPPKGAKKANLAAMSKALGIEIDEGMTHAALYDVHLTAQVADKLIYKLGL